jgi:hypothetical protein
MANVAQAGKAVGNLVGGLFHKKKTGESQAGGAAPPDSTAASEPPAAAATGAPDPYSQFVQMAAFTTETVQINTDAIPADRFEVPADWKKDEPKAAKHGEDDFTCPKSES